MSRPELRNRERTILHQIVRAWIDNGEPVGSRTLSRLEAMNLSPATIRGVMADLADLGYLTQPHTSAGRIPTGKAIREFASAVEARPLSAHDRERIYSAFGSAESIDDQVTAASRVLTEITRNVGIAAALPRTSQELEHLELVPLSERRLLMILATRDRMVRNKVVTLDREIPRDELTHIANYVNAHFAGWTLEKARAELWRRIEEERAMYDAVLRHLTLLCQKGLFVVDEGPRLAMDGTSWLIGLDLHITREKMRELFQALEEKRLIAALLDRFLDSASGQVGIQVGLEQAHPAMRELTLIGVSVDLPSGVRTRIAVLGPMRMQYERVISAVRQIGHTFETL
jgi:heat-inducible transcriptional repressor